MANYGVGMSLKLSSDKAVNSLRNVKKELKQLRSEITDVGKASESMFSFKSLSGWIGVLKEATTGMIEASKAQADYIENLNLLDTAYGSVENSGRELINTLSDLFGLDQSNLTRSLGVFRQMSSALGLTNETANLLSENLLKMQLDMASLYNLDFQRAGQILQVTLAGNTKSIRTLGGDITEATLQQTAWNMGIEKSIDNMNRAEKTMLIYLTVEQQLRNSQGDLAKTVNSVNNGTKIFTEQISVAGRQIGAIFIPILKSMLPVLNGVLMAFNTVVGGFLSLMGIDASSLADEFGTATSEIDDYFGGISDNIDDATESSKKLNLSLRDFDKLHTIKTPTDNKASSGGGGGISTGLGTIDKSILDALNEYDMRLDTMNNKALEIRDRFLEWLEIFDVLEEPISNIAGITYDGLIYVWDNVLVPLGEWAAWELMPTIVEGISNGLDLIYEIAKNLKPILEFIMENIVMPLARSIGDTVITVLESIADVLEFIAGNKITVGVSTLATGIGLLYVAGKNAYSIFQNSRLGKTMSAFVGIIKEGAKETGSFKDGLAKAVDLATTSKTPISKAGKVLKDFKDILFGIGTTATGIVITSNAIEGMAENGFNVGDALALLIGVVPTVAGAMQTLKAAFDLLGKSFQITPIGLFITALGGIATALGILKISEEDTKKAVDDTTDALQNQIDTANDAAEDSLTLINRSEELTDELLDMVDASGKVKKSDEERAKVILDQLSKALGEEYELIEGVIYINGEAVKSYDGIKNGINGVLEAKKKEIILNQYEQTYIQALQDRTKYTEELYKAMETGNQQAIEQALENYDKTIQLIDNYEALISATGDAITPALNNFYKSVNLMTDKAVEDSLYVANMARSELNNMQANITVNANTNYLRGSIDNALKKPFEVGLKVNAKGFDVNYYDFKADGGFVDTGQVFVANEKGPEYVGKMGTNTAVANQTQITDGIRNATRQGFMEAIISTNGSRSTAPIKIIAEGDTKGLLDFIKFRQDEDDRQYGF